MKPKKRNPKKKGFSEILDVKDFMGVTDLTLYVCWEVDK